MRHSIIPMELFVSNTEKLLKKKQKKQKIRCEKQVEKIATGDVVEGEKCDRTCCWEREKMSQISDIYDKENNIKLSLGRIIKAWISSKSSRSQPIRSYNIWLAQKYFRFHRIFLLFSFSSLFTTQYLLNSLHINWTFFDREQTTEFRNDANNTIFL